MTMRAKSSKLSNDLLKYEAFTKMEVGASTARDVVSLLLRTLLKDRINYSKHIRREDVAFKTGVPLDTVYGIIKMVDIEVPVPMSSAFFYLLVDSILEGKRISEEEYEGSTRKMIKYAVLYLEENKSQYLQDQM